VTFQSCADNSHPGVLRYVKNDHLSFEVPYAFLGQDRRYRPDFVAVMDDGHCNEDPLHLVLEVKGERDAADDAKDDTMRRMWVPAVNATGRFGRWAFLRVDGPYDLARVIDDYLASVLAPA
jgi:type III restriction enzyme